MRKSIILSIALFLIIAIPALSQEYTGRVYKHTTDPDLGLQTISQSFGDYTFQAPSGTAKEAGINWQYSDPASVGSKIQVSATSSQTFMSWWLNDERVSMYEDSQTAVWENFIETDWEWPIDLTEDGAWAASGYDTVAQVFSNAASVPFWEVIVDGTMLGVKLNPDGSKLFLARNYAGNAYVDCYTVGEDDPEWSTMFSGNGTVFTGSDDGSTMVLCQYSGYNKMWVIGTEDGDVIFDAFYKNQSPPALSYDGSIILNGDYSGNVHVYKYDELLNTYTNEWSYKVGGGGTSVWVVGMGVSGDGSTLAVGTLIFISGGFYEGEIYLFNSWSPEPLWIFEGAGDEVASIDFTFDGSLMAAAGWGPIDHSKPDCWLFRKQSNTPYFSVNTPGSFNAVDISDDGTLCAVTGKAVHNREFGSGGLLYNIDPHPGGGLLEGIVSLENSNSSKDVKITISELEEYFIYSQEDGAYLMQYIPEGSYTVTASKIGYYPVTNYDVELVEGETTTLDFTLPATGNPPYGLYVTQGAGPAVNLNWDLDNAPDMEGFNVYRKHIEGDLFPEEPIASLSNTEFSYEDTDVLPLTEYYYAITAIIEDGVESPYSNISSGWMSNGFVTGDISVFEGSTPIIDGHISPGEWDDAFMLDASDFLGKYDNTPNPVGSVIMYFKSNPEQSELYVACINNNDTELEDHDEVALYIDDNNDGSYPVPDDLSEGNYWAAYYSTGSVIKYRPIYNNGGVGEIIYLENPQIGVSDITGVIVYEFVIPIGDTEPWEINPYNGVESGIFSFVLDDPTAFDGYWPCWNPEIFIPLEYGQIHFGVDDEPPYPPQDLSIYWTGDDEVKIFMEWEQPDINDFNHFNIYYTMDGSIWELLGSTVGRQYIHNTGTDYLEFQVTTVDHGGQESDPSASMIYDITIDVPEFEEKAVPFVYPNPSSGPVEVSLVVHEAGVYSLKVLNLKGEVLSILHEGYLSNGLFTKKWDGEQGNLESGVYLLQLQGEGVLRTEKMIFLGR